MKQNVKINISLLVNYAHGLLAPETEAYVKQALEANERLRTQYAVIIQLMKTYPGEDPEALLENELTRRKEIMVSAKTRPFFTLKKMAVAAVFILLAGFGIYYAVEQVTQSPSYIAHQLIDQKYLVAEEKGAGTKQPPLWKEDFKKQAFAEVVKKLLPKDSLTHEEQFFLGLACLKTNPAQLREAERQLERATTSGALYNSDAWLYLGIAQLLQNKEETAAASLQRSRRPQAQDLLKRLRSK